MSGAAVAIAILIGVRTAGTASAQGANQGFPVTSTDVPLGPTGTYKVPFVIDPNTKFKPPAEIVSMRLPQGVTYQPLRAVRVLRCVELPCRKPGHSALVMDYAATGNGGDPSGGWFRGPGWGSFLTAWGLSDPTDQNYEDGWGFGWTRTEQSCDQFDATAVDLPDGVHVCEDFWQICGAAGASGSSTSGCDYLQVLQLYKQASDGGYLYLGRDWHWPYPIPTTPAATSSAFDTAMPNEALAIMGSADTVPHSRPLAWAMAPAGTPGM